MMTVGKYFKRQMWCRLTKALSLLGH